VTSEGYLEGIEPFLLKAQLRWTGHVMRMPDSGIPKQVFCGVLAAGRRPQCGPVTRYKDAVKVNMKQCGLNPSTLSRDSQDRSSCHKAADQFEKSQVEALEHKQAVRKFGAQPSSKPRRLAMQQLLPHLQLQDWALHPSTDTSLTSIRRIDGTVHDSLPISQHLLTVI